MCRHRQKSFCLKKYRPPRLLRLAGHYRTCDSDRLMPDEWPAKIQKNRGRSQFQLSYSGTPASPRRIREHIQENRCPTAFSSDDQWLRDMNGHDEIYQAQTSDQCQRSFTAVPVANTTTIPPLPAGILISKSSPTTASACNARARSLISSVA